MVVVSGAISKETMVIIFTRGPATTHEPPSTGFEFDGLPHHKTLTPSMGGQSEGLLANILGV